LARLREEHIQPLSVGQVIVATWEPNETAVLEVIRDLGLDLQIIFNKGAVMVLPNGVNKASGLAVALEDLGLSAHNVVAAGDAENDLAFMRLCGCAVAVSNALPAVKDAADWLTRGARGAGVTEAIDLWLTDEGHLLQTAIGRHSIVIGQDAEGGAILLRPDRGNILITGRSGGGKSTLATALLEKLSEAGYQFCLFDPEGDYAEFLDAVTFGDVKAVVSPRPALDAVRKLGNNVAINLLGSGLEERPGLFGSLFSAVLDIHAKYGRPHWLLIDEAHHMLPQERDVGTEIDLGDAPSAIFITVHPDTLAKGVLQSIGVVLFIGEGSLDMIDEMSELLGQPRPSIPERSPEVGEAIYWECGSGTPAGLIRIGKPKHALKRHTRKYAEGNLGDDRSFFFRGAKNMLNLRAKNLMTFLEIGEGVDEESYRHHLSRGDFSAWIRTSIKDEILADEIAGIEAGEGAEIGDVRRLIRNAVERRYTAPAGLQG
jgi:hypothetical protein